MKRAALPGRHRSAPTRRWATTVACLGLLATACAPEAGDDGAGPPAPPAETADALAGTSWQLVEFSAADGVVTTPPDASVFTLQLTDGGHVTLRLDCNHATGAWTSEPDEEDPDRGDFEFGPLAMTSAPCATAGLEERIATQAAFVRSYRLEDGRLLFDLMADGGTYTWEPLTPTDDVPQD